MLDGFRRGPNPKIPADDRPPALTCANHVTPPPNKLKPSHAAERPCPATHGIRQAIKLLFNCQYSYVSKVTGRKSASAFRHWHYGTSGVSCSHSRQRPIP